MPYSFVYDLNKITQTKFNQLIETAYKTGVTRILTVNVKNLVKLKGGASLIQISTDMVFSGNDDNPGPYSEDSVPTKNSSSLTWYGYTKNLAEKAVLNAHKLINPESDSSLKSWR